jgi:hypothetical protein
MKDMSSIVQESDDLICEECEKDHVSKVGIVDMLSHTKSKVAILTSICERNMD